MRKCRLTKLKLTWGEVLLELVEDNEPQQKILYFKVMT